MTSTGRLPGNDAPELSGAPVAIGPDTGPIQSFAAPEVWGDDFLQSSGWRADRHPRLLGDVDADGRQDLVGFGDDGVWLARSTGSQFEKARFVVPDFGYNQGWRKDQHVRVLADITGDGRADIVGFGDDGVWTAVSTGNGFGPATFVVSDFGYNQGWRVDKHIRILADVNGDGRADIVGFGDDGVWLALSNGSGGFDPPQFVIPDLGYNQGWRVDLHVRTLADITGNGRADIVAFGTDGVWTALSTGSGFAANAFVLADFGSTQGWDKTTRLLVDLDHDGKADILGFNNGVWTSRSTGDGGFAPKAKELGSFSGTHFVADFTGNGYPDIAAWNFSLVGPAVSGSWPSLWVAHGGPSGFSSPTRELIGFPQNQGTSVLFDNFVVGDVDGDGRQGLVCFNYQVAPGGVFLGQHTMVSRSVATRQPAPPPAPGNVQVTGATPTTLMVSWQDSGPDTRFYIVLQSTGGGAVYQRRGTSIQLYGLAPDIEYCFQVWAVSWWGVSAASAQVCGRTLPQPQQTWVDLSVPEVDLDSYFPNTGDMVSITWEERVDGTATPGAYTVQVLHDDEVIHQDRRPAGTSTGIYSYGPVTTQARQGDHSISVRVDSGGEVTEVTKDNNEATDGYYGE